MQSAAQKFRVTGSAVDDTRPNYFCCPNAWPFCHSWNIRRFLYISKGVLFLQQTWLCVSIYPSICFETLAGYTLRDHKTNDFILRELKITGILDKIDEYRLNWHLHLQKMPQNRIPFKSYHYRPQGRRTIGRPKKRWREQL